MSTYDYEGLKREALAAGMPAYMYEPVYEPLMPVSAWETLPVYYARHVEEKNAEVQGLLSSLDNAEAFVFFSDAHVRQNSMTSVPILRSILANTDVKTVIYGGDTVSAWATEESLVEDVRYFARAFSFAKPYMVRSNHDMYGKAFEYADRGAVQSNRALYDLIFREQASRVVGEDGKTYYCFDHAETKVRYIVIDTNELLTPYHDARGVWHCDVSISETEVAWFVSQLKRLPQDYVAVVAGHTPFFSQLRWNFHKACVFGTLIEAYNRRGKCAVMSWEGTDAFPVEADFSDAVGRVAMTVCGHGHYDDVYVSPDGCINLEIHCDAVKTNNGGSPVERMDGTVSESVLDVVILDRKTGRVRTVRYGAGEDRIL